MKIRFKKVRLLKDSRTVIITGSYKGREIKIRLSILQLAKVWGSDKKVLKRLESPDFDFGDIDLLEYSCKETRKLISEFPNVKLPRNRIEINFPDIRYPRKRPAKKVAIWGRDLSGWENEGIGILFPREIFPKELEKKDFIIILKPRLIELKIRK